jgi:uncharacterized protein YndB with AHSA1/START domain
MMRACAFLAWTASACPALGQAPVERTLVVSEEVNAPAEEVYRAFTTPEGIVKAWGVAKARVDFRMGGAIRTSYKPEADLESPRAIVNTILAYEPGRMLAIKPTAPEGAPDWLRAICASGFNVIRLEPLGARSCRVVVTGMGYQDGPLFDQAYAFFQRGNEATLAHMKAAFGNPGDAEEPGRAAPGAAEGLSPVRHEAVVAGAPGAAFRLLASGEGWREFFQVASRIELRPGGPFELYFMQEAPEGSRGSETCTVLSYIPDELLSFTWNAPPRFAHARGHHTWVVVRLEPAGAGETRVRLTHLGFAEQAAADPEHADEWRQVREYFQGAWGKVLSALEKHLKK